MDSKINRVREMWATHTIAQIAAEIGTSSSAISRLAVRHGLPGKMALMRGEVNPTDEEIKQRAAEVRAGWTAAEEERRRVGRAGAYEIPCLTSRQVFPTFQGQMGWQTK